MEPTAPDPRDDPERAPAQAFQSEDAEHTALEPPSAPVSASGPAAAYQHEDDEPVRS